MDSLALSFVKEGESDVFSDKSNMSSGSSAGGGEKLFETSNSIGHNNVSRSVSDLRRRNVPNANPFFRN